KLFCADGSWGLPPVRVGRCQAIKHNPNGLCFLLSYSYKLDHGTGAIMNKVETMVPHNDAFPS
ncbi:hypothetical protein, partial [Alkalihalophilus marmarensis]|uniref:hypothetical protein n=1 Tax=Alkalihalophilus marmarensis TaxID=521377 RepID=UPI00059D6713